MPTATLSAGTSNFGSCVSTQMTVRESTCCEPSHRCGQSTTTSSASGIRLRVAKTSRASTTVTWKPSSLPARASAALKSMAPKMYIRGAGANDATNTSIPVPSRSPSGP